MLVWGSLSSWGGGPIKLDQPPPGGWLEFGVPTPLNSSGVAFASIATGTSATCGLDTEGAAWCWGELRRGAASALRLHGMGAAA